MARLTGLGLLTGIALALATFLFAAPAPCADAPRPSSWEATVEAAKKEGQVNIYLYRYGKVLDIFRQDYPEIRPYVLTGTGALSTPSQGPHPNAAKVFINWYLSRRGQIALQKLGDPDEPPNSARIDIPKDEIQAHNRLIDGRKYFDGTRPEFEDIDSAFKIAIQAMEAR